MASSFFAARQSLLGERTASRHWFPEECCHRRVDDAIPARAMRQRLRCRHLSYRVPAQGLCGFLLGKGGFFRGSHLRPMGGRRNCPTKTRWLGSDGGDEAMIESYTARDGMTCSLHSAQGKDTLGHPF